MDTNNLRKWSVENSVEQRTIKGFWENINSYKEEDEEEFQENFGTDFDELQLTVDLKGVSLHIDQWDNTKTYETISYGFDFIVSLIPIVYKNKHLGNYKMLFTLKGEIFDDFFIIF
ncbi:hypothetical protein [Gottfriedia acidiceleris]|uniref:hypothetical protein n=1 Tax=Gottfriedia acidiceleris TaxID=371036 RepID=UPI0030003800